LFRNPCTKVEFLQDELRLQKRTALNYLDKIAEMGFYKNKIRQG
jgi:hypothetical protein